jgi:hypothetical protein
MRGGMRLQFDTGLDLVGPNRRSTAMTAINPQMGYPTPDPVYDFVNYFADYGTGNLALLGPALKEVLSASPSVRTDFTQGVTVDVEVPYRGLLPWVSAQRWVGGVASSANTDFNQVAVSYTIQTGATNPGVPPVTVYYAGADDFVLNMFLFTPLLYTPTF